jgi:hypothetical protein
MGEVRPAYDTAIDRDGGRFHVMQSAADRF